MYSARKSRGFTLVELLVVIAIIAILATIGALVYGNAQKKARNAKRVSDLNTVEQALHLYSTDHDGAYPTTGSVWKSECADGGNLDPNAVIPELLPKYLHSFPSDPRTDRVANTSCYMYWSDGANFKFRDDHIAELSAEDYQAQRNFIDPARDGGTNNCLVDGNDVTAWAVYTDTACSQ
jgi:prepilin-type N-terminal cleavage/methylation domain-containing protein